MLLFSAFFKSLKGGNLKKTFITVLLLIIMLFSGTLTAYAEGSGNVDGGGGSLNHGTKANNWPGNSYQGVRVTVVNAQTGEIVGGPIDFSNKDVSGISGKMIHFGKVSKLQYRNGAALTAQTSQYVCYRPDATMPKVISSNSSKASIEQIRRYFCSEGAASMVAGKVGMDVATLTDGSYKLVIEPVIYLIYNNLYFAMTTTEAGLYNQMVGGDLGAHFPTVVMKNLALALFLEKDDMGFSAYTGSRTTARTTGEMIQTLGIGIISYKGAPVTAIEYDAVYRTDTDVITSTTLSTTSQIDNDGTATVTFNINGNPYQMTGVVIPANGSQLVWVKWHTPSEPGEINITISTNKGQLSNHTIHAYVADFNENPPPDPMADDRYDGYVQSSLPQGQDITNLSWGIWRCWWHANWVWIEKWEWEENWEWETFWDWDYGEHDEDCPPNCPEDHIYWYQDREWVDNGEWVDHGYWKDQGWYEYAKDNYSASLSASMQITPDEKNPTVSGRIMKSGYGINMIAAADMRSSAPSSHITQVQTCVAYFPEFNYADYWRLLERTSPGYYAQFAFRRNEYSTYNRRTHFTPVWFPDGNYTVYAEVMDAWTPAGMLQISLNDSLTIYDNLFSDWHVRPVN